jgi:AcrR family transcriptional regulator
VISVGTTEALDPTTERPPLQRDSIVAAARELIAADGLEALSLRRLGATLGVTAPALYAHVDDKHDLLRAVAEGQFDELLDRYSRTATGGTAIERVRAHCRAYVDLARESPELFRVMFLFPPDLGASTAIPPGEELPAATGAFAVGVAAIAEAIADGDLVAEDPLLAALTLWSGVHGVASVLLLGFGLAPEFEDALVDELISRLLAGYRP